VLEAVGDPLVAVAVRNGRRQVVLSGPVETLATVAAVARALQVTTTALTVAYPFHSPMLAEAVPEFAARIRHIEPRPLRALVFSPILGRFHRAGDALGEHLASSLVAPVDFDGALQRLHDAGARTFVECATAGTLTRLVQRCLPEASVLPALTAAGLDAEPARGHGAGLAAVPAPPVPAVRSAPAVDTTPSRPAVAPAPLAAVAAVPPMASSGGDRDELFAELVAIYAQALEYPAEVFTEDVALEEDLGIDSVKQTELMARVAEQYALPEPPLDFRLGDYDTMGKLVDYVWTTAATVDQPAQPVPVAL
jgi:malonyl CoA-acyl carrier protein transacylase